MNEAITMYRSFGFRECSPYYDYPEKRMPYFVFMDLPLVVMTAWLLVRQGGAVYGLALQRTSR